MFFYFTDNVCTSKFDSSIDYFITCLFQILPHLLSYMNVDSVGASLDWGTLCIYACSNSCEIENTYKREYIFKQDIV